MKTFGYRLVAFMTGILLLALAGCVKNEFSVSFEFPKDFAGNYIVTYYAWDFHKGAWLETTVPVQEGVARIGGVTRRPTLVYVNDASSPSNSITLYVERGDNIVISGDGRDMNAWSIKGNRISETWSLWRKESAGKDKQKAIETFVRKNDDSPLSTILLLTEWDRRSDPDGFIRLWNVIDKDARDQDIVEMCGSPDFPGVEFTVNADGTLSRAKEHEFLTFTVRSRDNGVDTLRLGKSKAAFLYFYQENNSDRKTAIDSIKVLAREYPDSALRIISDISAESDSMAWAAAVRSDTVKGIIRGWMPHGLADSDMVRLGIGRLPWLIVTDRNGKQTYSGNDVKDATAAFRKEMKRKDNNKKVPDNVD